jgi:hypothetical protein
MSRGTEDLIYLKAKYIKLPLYTAKRKWFDSQTATDAFILLAKFLVPFFFKYKTISNENATHLEKNLIKVCSVIQNGTNPMDDLYTVIKYLLSLYDDSKFQSDFEKEMNDPTTDKVTKKYVLHRINSYLQPSDVRPIDGLELEHVLPQKPKTNGPKGWDESVFFAGYAPAIIPYISPPRSLDKKFSKIWCNLLGNLTLLSKPVNTQIKNFNFNTKLSASQSSTSVGYFTSGLGINQKTIINIEDTDTAPISRTDWTVNSILNRTKYFHELALKIWELPKIYCEDNTCDGSVSHVDPEVEDIDKVGNIRCKSKKKRDGTTSTTECNKKLIVKWSSDVPMEYKVPSVYQFENTP